MSIPHRYSTRFQMSKALKAQAPKAQEQKAQEQKAQVQKAQVQKLEEQLTQVPNKPTTHRYETRLQSKLKMKHEDCKKISDLLQKAITTPEITVSPERLHAVAALFEGLYYTDLWKTHERLNAIIRIKISEIRSTVHMILTSYDETVGIVVSGRTILMGPHYISAARRALYAMEALEMRMSV
jgi:hypothetical protein